MIETIRRFIVVMAFAVWVGGFTFYGSVVIPAATEFLGDHTQAGFITQHVTVGLNWIGIVTLVILLWDVVTAQRAGARWVRRTIFASWIFLAGIEVALIVMHPMMDRMLDRSARSILDYDRFDLMHHAYLWLSTAQWFGCLGYLIALLAAWRFQDRAASVSSAGLSKETA
jgi:hypothetical protein